MIMTRRTCSSGPPCTPRPRYVYVPSGRRARAERQKLYSGRFRPFNRTGRSRICSRASSSQAHWRFRPVELGQSCQVRGAMQLQSSLQEVSMCHVTRRATRTAPRLGRRCIPRLLSRKHARGVNRNLSADIRIPWAVLRGSDRNRSCMLLVGVAVGCVREFWSEAPGRVSTSAW